MRTLIQVALSALGNATMSCPPGKKIRLLSVEAIIATGADGDQTTVSITKSGTTHAASTSASLSGASTTLHAAVGLTTTGPSIQSFTVAGGVNTLFGQADFNVALPDIWWLNDMSVTVAPFFAGPGTALYEQDDV